MADRIANALEKLVKGGGNVERVADLLEESSQCSKKSEKSSNTDICEIKLMT